MFCCWLMRLLTVVKSKHLHILLLFQWNAILCLEYLISILLDLQLCIKCLQCCIWSLWNYIIKWGICQRRGKHLWCICNYVLRSDWYCKLKYLTQSVYCLSKWLLRYELIRHSLCLELYTWLNSGDSMVLRIGSVGLSSGFVEMVQHL